MHRLLLVNIKLDIALSHTGFNGYYLEGMRLLDSDGEVYVRKDVRAEYFISSSSASPQFYELTSPNTDQPAFVSLRLYRQKGSDIDIIAYTVQVGTDVATLHVAYGPGPAGPASPLRKDGPL